MWRGVLFTIAFLLPTGASAAPMQCAISAKFVCEPTGCKSVQPLVYNKVDIEKRSFSRCGSSSCDDYEAFISKSGAFVLVEIPGRGVTAKIEMASMSFHEVVSLGHQIYVSYGSCR